MFRTRDFILFFTIVIFLLVAIGSALFKQPESGNIDSSPLGFVEVGEGEFTAEVALRETVSREARLAEMREKIAKDSGLVLSAPELALTDDGFLEEELEMFEIEALEVVGLDECIGYRKFSGFWPVQGLKFDVVEGSRIVYMETISEYQVDTALASSRQVFLQLSTLTVRSANSACIPSDVIGVAKDGSLIRNDEAGLYSIFGAGTLIGYALDGFPIYGSARSSLADDCGGWAVAGQYRYHLSSDRSEVLHCFAGVPVSL